MASAAWQFQVDRYVAFRYEDVSLSNVAPMTIQPLDLTVNNIDLSGAEPLKLALKAAVNQHGSLEPTVPRLVTIDGRT